jgi:phage tail sheath protein FI
VFSLVIRQGNDNSRNPSILETFANLSLDPKSPNYIARVIGDQTIQVRGSGTDIYLQVTGSFPNSSRYVRVKEVLIKTPDYFDNNGVAKPQYTASIPVTQSGTFGAGAGDNVKAGMKLYNEITDTDTQGLVGASYTDALNLLANPNEFRYNIITVPGLTLDAHPSVFTTLITNTEERGDAIAVVDPVLYAKTVTNAISSAATQDSSYAASYWPWCQTTDPNTGQLVWVPASTMIPGVYAYTDRVSEPWFAPAGINRGGLGTVRQVEKKLTQTDKDTLYTGKVNPLATLPGRGVVVFGQKTLQTKASALDRVNVRRLLISLKSYISQVADNLVFEQNTAATRNQFLSQVNPYLESVQQRQGLYAFKVVMDDTNNTPDVIDRNQLVGAIYLQPTKTAEFIYLNFNILPTGATFPG